MDRIERLERTVRLQGRLLMVTGAALAVTLLAAAGPAIGRGTLRVERLEVVDGQGRVRVTVGAREDGSYGIMMHGREGESQAAMVARADGSVSMGGGPFGERGGFLLACTPGESSMVMVQGPGEEGRTPAATLSAMPLSASVRARSSRGTAGMYSSVVQSTLSVTEVTDDPDELNVIWQAP